MYKYLWIVAVGVDHGDGSAKASVADHGGLLGVWRAELQAGGRGLGGAGDGVDGASPGR